MCVCTVWVYCITCVGLLYNMCVYCLGVLYMCVCVLSGCTVYVCVCTVWVYCICVCVYCLGVLYMCVCVLSGCTVYVYGICVLCVVHYCMCTGLLTVCVFVSPYITHPLHTHSQILVVSLSILLLLITCLVKGHHPRTLSVPLTSKVVMLHQEWKRFVLELNNVIHTHT